MYIISYFIENHIVKYIFFIKLDMISYDTYHILSRQPNIA